MTAEAPRSRQAEERSSDLVDTLGRHLHQRTPSPAEEHVALDGVWRELRNGARDSGLGVRLARGSAEREGAGRTTRMALAAAAGVLLTLTVSGALTRMWINRDAQAVVDTVDGTLYRDAGSGPHVVGAGDRVKTSERLRTNGGAGAQIVLTDGSRVEMRSRSELFLERADDGVRIRLLTGGIIVTAAKQRTGHLYVQTKDVTVSVVGTVFLVNAEEAGSRVAVIEGEVRVQQGDTEKTLLPGQQIVTSALMTAPTLSQEVAWSRSAHEHVASLQQFAVAAPAATAQNAPPEGFDVVSIRRSVVPAGDSGRGAAGGGNANRRNRRGDNPCSLEGEPALDPRRFDAVNATLVQLVSWAYGLDCWMNRGPDVLFGGPPDWIRRDGYDVIATIPEGRPSYTRQQLKEHDAPALQRMLQSMLADRFRLTTRREMREMPVYVLSAAKDGPRFTRANSDARMVDLNGNPVEKPPVVNGIPAPVRLLPPADWASPEFSLWQESDSRDFMRLTPSEIHGRKRTMTELVSVLSLFTGRPVLDRTALTGHFNFFLEFAVVECSTCPFAARAPDARRPESGDAWPSRSLFSVLEQVGLELKPSREPIEVLVIERVDRPTEN